MIRKREWNAPRYAAMLALGAITTATVGYFFDPERGRSRRGQGGKNRDRNGAKDELKHASRRSGRPSP